MPQYLVGPSDVRDGRFVLAGEEARHLARVARARVGESVRLFDGRGRRWDGKIESVERGQVSGTVSMELSEEEPRARVELYLALVPRPRFEDALEKAVELGVASIAPLVTERGGVRLSDARKEAKLERWNAIALAASKQCLRPRLPSLRPPVTVAEAVSEGPGWIAHVSPISVPAGGPFFEGERPAPGAKARLLIGPEGGFTEAEVAQARSAGFRPLGLGSNILRTETAAVAACSLLLLG